MNIAKAASLRKFASLLILALCMEMPIIYWLQPLNAGAITLLTLLALSIVVILDSTKRYVWRGCQYIAITLYSLPRNSLEFIKWMLRCHSLLVGIVSITSCTAVLRDETAIPSAEVVTIGEGEERLCNVLMDSRRNPVVRSDGNAVVTVATFHCPEEVAAVEPASPPPAPLSESQVVYFGSDSTKIDQVNMTRIDDFVFDVRDRELDSIYIQGYSDRTGSADYNMHLSAQRAERVATELIKRGIPEQVLVVEAHGESSLGVPTPDGVPELANRRVVLSFGGVDSVDAVRIPVGSVLFSDQKPLQLSGGFGAILLSKATTVMRNQAICEAFFRSFLRIGDGAVATAGELRVTYWLDRREFRKEIETECEETIKYYDFERSARSLARLQLLESEGPVLVAWSNVQEETLIFDMSRFQMTDLVRGMRIWQSRIVKDAEVWAKGFWLTVAREELRNFLQNYGEGIVRAVHAAGVGLADE